MRGTDDTPVFDKEDNFPYQYNEPLYIWPCRFLDVTAGMYLKLLFLPFVSHKRGN
jgi:hypothetical protein